MPAQIDMRSIMSKVSALSKSGTGKKMMADKIEEYKKEGVRQTAAGSFIVTEDVIHEIAQELIFDLQRMAARLQSEGVLAYSVAKHFWSLYVEAFQSDRAGNYKVYIAFADDLSRQSLLSYSASGARTGEGIDNIISLFNTGYSARGAVHGFWENAGVDTWSVPYRPRLGFMEDAIDKFNMKYASVCEAELLW